jgi:hypothetical protein
MSFIKSRLRRAEAAARKGSCGRCQACGLPPDGPGYIVLCGNDPAEHIPEVCPECGRTTKTHIRVAYEGEEGEGALLG